MQPSIFTKIIERQLPAEIVYEDEQAIAILTVEPHNPGHSLVIPKKQIENWEDLPDELYIHCLQIVKKLGKVLKSVYRPEKLGIATVGFEVPHVHIHLIPLNKISDLDHTSAHKSSPEVLKVEADKIRQQIKYSDMEQGK